jgi:two-component system CheB/CheR fusion protein
LLIYLQPVLQRKAMESINFSLNPQGLLVLGSSETTGELADLYEPLNQSCRIYISKGKRYPSSGSDFSIMPETVPWQHRTRSIHGVWPRGHDEDRFLNRILQALAGDYIPLMVVVNEQMEALHILGNSDGYFQRPSGLQTNDITKNVVKDLAIPLATGLQKVFKTGEELKYTGIRIHWRDELKTVQMRIRSLPGKKGQEPLAAVFIEEVNDPPREARLGWGARLRCRFGGGTAHPRSGAGTAILAGKPASDHRGAGNLQRGLQADQRGIAGRQRGAAKHQ